MSLRIGRLLLEDPETWPEPIGDQSARVGGVAAPGARGGVSISPALTVAPPDSGARADRQRTRRQLRSLVNNAPLRLRGVWVAWSEDDEQDAWMVPGQATIDLPQGGLVSGFFTVGGLELAVIGRPRTHRPAVLARVRDLRIATEPKDTHGRLYGAAFDGTTGNGSSVTPAPLVWLPSDTQDVIIAGPGTPSYGATRQGRGGSSLTAIQGVGDLSVIHFEQDPAHRLRGDVILYDRHGETGTAWDAVNPHPSWEEVYGADWPWVGRVAIENSLCRVIETDDAVLSWAYWDGTQYAAVGDVVASVGTTLTTVLSRSLVEWSPDRCVVRLVMHAPASPGSRAEVFITLQRGWLGPRIEVYAGAGNQAAVGVLPLGGVSANNVPASFTASVNSGSITSPSHGITVAVVQPTMASAAVTGGVAFVSPGSISSVRVERCPIADVATAHPVLGADVLAATQYPQTIVAR